MAARQGTISGEAVVVDAKIKEEGKIVILDLSDLAKHWGYPRDLTGVLDGFLHAFDLAFFGAVELPGAGKAKLWAWRAAPSDEEAREILAIADADLPTEEKLAKLYEAIKKVLERHEREDPDLIGLSDFCLLYATDGWDAFAYVVRTEKQRVRSRLLRKERQVREATTYA
jgi:hypothetical protein